MTFAIELTSTALIIAACSCVLFLFVTWLAHSQGIFDGGDPFGIAFIFGLALYAALWATPSLLAWAVYATWFKT